MEVISHHTSIQFFICIERKYSISLSTPSVFINFWTQKCFSFYNTSEFRDNVASMTTIIPIDVLNNNIDFIMSMVITIHYNPFYL